MRQMFGQNFLTDINIAKKIVMSAELSLEDSVLEIGPGKGILTSIIAPQVKDLSVIEIDKNLALNLQANKTYSSVKIINCDFLKYNFEEIEGKIKLISNLPYNVSTAIIEKILPNHNWTTAVFMVQKEVGDRIKAKVASSDYGSFSLFCQYYAEVEQILKVGPGCFFPKPKVDSIVLKMKNKFCEKIDDRLVQFIRKTFQQKRKTILNSFSNALNCQKDAVLAVLNKAGINPMLRPGNLTFEMYKDLFNTYFFKQL